MHVTGYALSAQTSAPPSPLSLVLSRLRAKDCAVVFDLDSTLLDNRPRQAAIIREYGASVREAAFAAVSANHFRGWDLKVAARNAGVAAESVEAHYAELRRFWKERFFTSAYCRYDVAVPGAPAFVGEVAQLARVIYLTGRPPEMRAGTEESLIRLGFPAPGVGKTLLLLKPDPDLHDDAWKAQAIALANEHGPITAAFDNEPTHINAYRQAWPNAVCVRVDTDHSGRPVPLASGIVEIKDFAR